MGQGSAVQSAIADHFQDQSRWRAVKAAEYPDDHRNGQAADGLEELAQYVLGLPEADPRIVAVGLLCDADGAYVFHTEQGDHRGAFVDPNYNALLGTCDNLAQVETWLTKD